MGRPAKFNLDYFPLDVEFFDDHKILSIEEEFHIKGGYLAIRIMAMVYKENGYYMDFPDKFEYTIAKRVGNGFTGALVGEIFKCCLKHGLFDQDKFERFRIVTSKGIQTRWLTVMETMRRKVTINQNYWIVSSEETHESSEETRISSEETAPSAAESTQKEIKGKEIKVKHSSGGKAPEAKAKKETNVYWKEFVDTFEKFYLKHFNEKYMYMGKDWSTMDKIYKFLKKRAENKKAEWTMDYMTGAFEYFLKNAFEKDEWLKKNFTIPNMLSQFNQIVNTNRNENNRTGISANGNKHLVTEEGGFGRL